MGFYSFKCKNCGESIKAPYDLPKSMAWQNAVVLVIDENTRHVGSYDGYGRVNISEPVIESWPKRTVCTVKLYEDTQTSWNGYGTQYGVWHERCLPEEVDYIFLASESADDQGHFYERPEGDTLLSRAFQRPDADGRVDTRLMSELEAAESLEKPELETPRPGLVEMSLKSFWRHLRDHDWRWWDERDDEERIQRGSDEGQRIFRYARHFGPAYQELFKAFSNHWGYDNMQAVIDIDNLQKERRPRPSLPLEPTE